MAVKTFGTQVTIGGTAIGGLTTVEFSGGDVNSIDTTTYDAENNTKTYVGGLIESGSCDLTFDLVVDDAGQLELASEVSEVAAIVVTYPSVMTRTFSAVVGKINYSGELDGKVTGTCSLKITGAITDAAI